MEEILTPESIATNGECERDTKRIGGAACVLQCDDSGPVHVSDDACTTQRKRAPRPKNELTEAQKKQLRPDGSRDLENLRSLCQFARRKECTLNLQADSETRLGPLLNCIENWEKLLKNSRDATAIYTLYWRVYCMTLAEEYQNFTMKLQTTSGTTPSPAPKKRKRKRQRKQHLHQQDDIQRPRSCFKDQSLNWLTAELFGNVNPHTLSTSDSRRTRVRYWLRVGQPLLDYVKLDPAILVAPGMRLNQES